MGNEYSIKNIISGSGTTEKNKYSIKNIIGKVPQSGTAQQYAIKYKNASYADVQSTIDQLEMEKFGLEQYGGTFGKNEELQWLQTKRYTLAQKELEKYKTSPNRFAAKYADTSFEGIKYAITNLQDLQSHQLAHGGVKRETQDELAWLLENLYTKPYTTQADYKAALKEANAKVEDLSAKAYNIVQGKANGWYTDGNTPESYAKQLKALQGQINTYLQPGLRVAEKEEYVEKAKNDIHFKKYADLGEKTGNKRSGFLNITKENDIIYNRLHFNEMDWMADIHDASLTDRQLAAHNMTDEEFQIYCYYYAKEKQGKVKKGTAEKYFQLILGTVNQRTAAKKFKEIEGNTLLEIASGFSSGVEQFGSGIKNLFSSEEYIPYSSSQYLSGMVRNDLADDGFKLFGKSLGQITYDLTFTTGNVLPSALLSFVPYVGPAAAAVAVGASAAGNAYQDALNSGFGKGQARAYSTLVGVSEGGLQYLLGGIGKLGKLSNKGVTKFVGKLDNTLAKISLKYGDDLVRNLQRGATLMGKSFSEFSEEYLQATLEPFYRNIALGENNRIHLISEESLYEGMLGALSAGFINLGSAVASKGRSIDGVAGIDYNNDIRGEWNGKELLYNDRGQNRIENADTQGRAGAIQETAGGMEGGLYRPGDANRTLGDRGDTGRVEITAEQAERLKTTAVKNADGTPKPVYHFTGNMEFTTFSEGDTGFHFGNAAQAAQRAIDLQVQGRVIQACLDIKNPVRIDTDIMSWQPDALSMKLYGNDIILQNEMQKIFQLARESGIGYNSPAAVELWRILAEKGYDGVVYQNGFEGEGESYIAFYPEQVIMLDDGLSAGNFISAAQPAMDNAADVQYNMEAGSEAYVRTDEFRRLQEASKGMSDKEIQLYRTGEREVDDGLRERFSRSVQSLFMGADDNGISYADGLLNLTAKGNDYNVYANVNGALFHDVFEIARNYLKFGELVDLHGVETTEDGIGYNDCYNYLSQDGLSGFSITPDGDLISVFNASGKSGFLRAIAPIVKEKAKTLDCYASSEQNLQAIYASIFDFQTASIMEYNMEYDHDAIAKNHGEPQVAFMVNTDEKVETRHFGKEEYEEAVAYRAQYIPQADTKTESTQADPETGSAFSMEERIWRALQDYIAAGQPQTGIGEVDTGREATAPPDTKNALLELVAKEADARAQKDLGLDKQDLVEDNGNIPIQREQAGNSGINSQDLRNNDMVTYRRVQGGKGNNASQFRIQVNSDGTIHIPNKKANLNLSIDNGEHAQYFVNKRGGHAQILEVELPKWFDDFLKENAIPQENYKKNKLNQNETAPKITDMTTPGQSYELPAPWIEWLEEYGRDAKIIDP